MFAEPMDLDDMTDLSKLVHYRYFPQGRMIEDDKLTDESGKEFPAEIYIILKGKVRLGFPLEYCGVGEKGHVTRSNFNIINEHLRKEQEKNPII